MLRSLTTEYDKFMTSAKGHVIETMTWSFAAPSPVTQVFHDHFNRMTPGQILNAPGRRLYVRRQSCRRMRDRGTRLMPPIHAGLHTDGRTRPQIQRPAPLANTLAAAMLKGQSTNGGNAEERFEIMFNLFVFAILSGIAGLIAYEIFQEVGGSSGALHDRYHE